MIRTSVWLGVVFATCGASASTSAQFNVIGPGSTADGDYFRGVGVAAFGMGYYNLATAQATSINVDSAIRVNEYIASVLKNENRENAAKRARIWAEREAAHKAINDRKSKAPDERDVLIGDGLNRLLQEILDMKVDETSYRLAQVPMKAGVVRAIPFHVGEELNVISMRRLRARGKDRWPVGLQDDLFASGRRAYERAVDDALLEQIEGKMSLEAIARVDAAVAGLKDLIERTPDLPKGGKLANDARAGVRDLEAAARVFKSTIAEHVVGELDKFAGTTVHDLTAFMQAHKIRFAPAKTPEEVRLYVELYSALVQQRDILAQRGVGRDRGQEQPGIDLTR